MNKSFTELTPGGKRIAIAMATIFLLAGGMKLFGFPYEALKFTEWNYPFWFMYLIGAIEVASAAMLFTRFALIGSVMICFVMIGAVGTHAIYGEYLSAPVPLILLLLDAVLARQLAGLRPSQFFNNETVARSEEMPV